MTRNEIVEELARLRVVEAVVARVTAGDTRPETADLCQMLYELLLTYHAERIVTMWETGGRPLMEAFITRVAKRQYRGDHSPFALLFRRYRCDWEGRERKDGW